MDEIAVTPNKWRVTKSHEQLRETGALCYPKTRPSFSSKEFSGHTVQIWQVAIKAVVGSASAGALWSQVLQSFIDFLWQHTIMQIVLQRSIVQSRIPLLDWVVQIEAKAISLIIIQLPENNK